MLFASHNSRLESENKAIFYIPRALFGSRLVNKQKEETKIEQRYSFSEVVCQRCFVGESYDYESLTYSSSCTDIIEFWYL